MALRSPTPPSAPAQRTGGMAGVERLRVALRHGTAVRLMAALALLAGVFTMMVAAVQWAALGSTALWLAAGTALAAGGACVALVRAAESAPAAAAHPGTSPAQPPEWALRAMRLAPNTTVLVEAQAAPSIRPARRDLGDRRWTVRAAREGAGATPALADAPLEAWLTHWHAAHADAGAAPSPVEVQRWLQRAGTAADMASTDLSLHGWRALPLGAAHDPVAAPWWVIWRPVSAASAAPPVPTPMPVPVDNERESIAYSVSHDLRAPIRVIEGFTRIVREDYDGVLDRVGRDHLDRVLGAATRMNHMIDALMALSRLSTQPLVRERVALSELAEQILGDLRRQAPERVVQTRIAPGIVVHGDTALLHSVLENLLGNAWKYSARRAVAVIELGVTTAAQAQAQALGGPAVPPDQPVYFVSDNGAGFDMRFAHRLFGAFQRLHSASDFAGTGVGLASVRRIVRRHGGDIWAQGAVDKGSCFYFTLG